jgi:hypothetical protein
MMCWGAGRERSEDKYARLLQAAGWTHLGSWYPRERTIGIVEGGVARSKAVRSPDELALWVKRTRSEIAP